MISTLPQTASSRYGCLLRVGSGVLWSASGLWLQYRASLYDMIDFPFVQSVLASPIIGFGAFVCFGGLTLMVLGEWVWALGILIRTWMVPPTRRHTTYLRVRIPRADGNKVTHNGAALFRELHDIFPPGGVGCTASFILSAKPNTPVEMGISIIGQTASLRDDMISDIRKKIQAIDHEVYIDEMVDPLDTALATSHLILSRTLAFQISRPCHQEVVEDYGKTDPMSSFVEALETETHLHTEVHWTVAAHRASLRYHTELYHVTCRLLVVATNQADRRRARRTMREITRSARRKKITVNNQVYRLRPVVRAGYWVLLVILSGILWFFHPLMGGVLLAVIALGVPLVQRGRQCIRTRTLAPSPPNGIVLIRPWHQRDVVVAAILGMMWHLPSDSLASSVKRLPNKIIHPPDQAFLNETDPPWVPVGSGIRRNGESELCGMLEHNALEGVAVAAPPGTGKTQWAIRLFVWIREKLGRFVYLFDGKGDDPQGLVGKARRMLSLEAEAKLALLDPLSTWPRSLNPLLGIDTRDDIGVEEAIGQVQSIFASLDPEMWEKSTRMPGLLSKLLALVLYGEPYPTLAHALQALDDVTYRMSLVDACRFRNPEVARYWEQISNGTTSIGDSTKEALRERFMKLLDNKLLRYMMSLPVQSFSFEEAIAEEYIVMAPIPEMRLGGYAGPIGMLLFQMLVRAFFNRPGSDLTRRKGWCLLDEFDFLVRKANPEHMNKALTKGRSFGMITILLHQYLEQLGAFRHTIMNMPNRLIMRVDDDAKEYAALYHQTIGALDIAQQENHCYVRIKHEKRALGPYSVVPLPWLPVVDPVVPEQSEGEPVYSAILPAPTPRYQMMQQLVYTPRDEATHARVVEHLANKGSETLRELWLVWCEIAAAQRAYILRNPACIPMPTMAELAAMPTEAPALALANGDRAKVMAIQRDVQRMRRQDILSNLLCGIPPILADAMYSAIRTPIVEPAAETGRRIANYEAPEPEAEPFIPTWPERELL